MNTDQAADPFSSEYADIYDLLHDQKPYAAEAEFVLSIFEKQKGRLPRNLVDLACGTGRHLAEFGKLGVQIHGNDLSAGMLRRADQRLTKLGIQNYRLSESPMQLLSPKDCDHKFELATAFYTALGYLVEPRDLDIFFRNVRQLLVDDGLLFADFWHGPKMSRDFSPSRTKSVKLGDIQAERRSQVNHFASKSALKVDFEFDIRKTNSDEKSVIRESHLVRYHSLPEIETLLLAHGFELLEAGPFFDESAELDHAWNFYICAKKMATAHQ